MYHALMHLINLYHEFDQHHIVFIRKYLQYIMHFRDNKFFDIIYWT